MSAQLLNNTPLGKTSIKSLTECNNTGVCLECEEPKYAKTSISGQNAV